MSELREKYEIRKKAVSDLKKAAQEISSIFCNFKFEDVGRDIFQMEIKQIMETIPVGLVK